MLSDQNSLKPHLRDVLSPELMLDPFDLYDALRHEDPVHLSQKGYWVLFRYHDVHNCLRDDRFSNRPARYSLLHARNRDKFIAAQVANRLVAFMDGPNHSAMRAELINSLGPSIRSRLPDLSRIADTLIDDLPRNAEFDLVEKFAKQFAFGIATHLLGYPSDISTDFMGWASDFFYLFHASTDANTFRRLNDSLEEFREATRRLLHAR